MEINGCPGVPIFMLLIEIWATHWCASFIGYSAVNWKLDSDSLPGRHAASSIGSGACFEPGDGVSG